MVKHPAGELYNMRRLILFRHGKAETAGPSGGDRERPLAERGWVDSAATARWLSESGFVPDLVLVSPAARTLETWDAALPHFPAARVEHREALYLASADTISEVARDTPADAASVMVIGHNPGLQELGAQLAEHGAPRPQAEHMEEGFPTAAAWVFRLPAAGEAVLEAIYEPPRRGGDPPRWQYLERPGGGRA
jgi:phosphohistidine phosphatase